MAENDDQDKRPVAKTGAYQTRYHPLSNPPLALGEILKVLLKRVRDKCILTEKPSVAIHGMRDYSGESWGPADDASRFLFRWGCVIPLDNGKWLLDQERFEYVIARSEARQIPEAATLPNVRIGQLLSIPDTSPSAEEDVIGTMRLVRTAETKIGDDVGKVELEDAITSDESSAPPFTWLTATGPISSTADLLRPIEDAVEHDPLDDEIQPENLLSMLESIKDKHTEVVKESEFGTEGLWGLQLLVEQGAIQKELLPFAYDVLILLYNIIDEIAGWREQNAALKGSLEKSVVWRDQLDFFLLVIDDGFDDLAKQENGFDASVSKLENIRAALAAIEEEAISLTREITAMDAGLKEFSAWSKTVRLDNNDLAGLLGLRKRIRDAEELIAGRRQKQLRFTETLADPGTLQAMVESELEKIKEYAARHKQVAAQLISWTVLCEKAGMELENISWLKEKVSKLKTSGRDLEREANNLKLLDRSSATAEISEESLTEAVDVLTNLRGMAYPKGSILTTMLVAETAKPAQAMPPAGIVDNATMVVEAAPTASSTAEVPQAEKVKESPVTAVPAGEVLTLERLLQQCSAAEVVMVKRVVIALASVISEKVKYGRTCPTIINHVLAPMNLVDWTVSPQRLETLIRKLSKIRPQVLKEVIEHGSVFQRPMEYGRTLADTWAKELGISESARDTMLQLRKSRDNEQYSPETREYYKKLREERKKKNGGK